MGIRKRKLVEVNLASTVAEGRREKERYKKAYRNKGRG